MYTLALALALAMPADSMIPVATLGNLWGFAVCGPQGPQAFISLDAPTAEWAQLIAHEENHRALMQTFPNCAAYNRWLERPMNRVESEARAYCASSRQDVRSGRFLTLRAAVDHHARTFAWYFWGGLTEPAAAWIRRYCP